MLLQTCSVFVKKFVSNSSSPQLHGSILSVPKNQLQRLHISSFQMATAAMSSAKSMAASVSTCTILPSKPSRQPICRNPRHSNLLKNPEPRSFLSCKFAAAKFSSSSTPLSYAIPKAGGSNLQSDSSSTESHHRVFHGQCFVVDDNIDTDQIIPAEYLTLVPSKPDEYEKLGSYAMIGLPARYGKFIAEGQIKTQYPIIIAGANFGCGSSREHAPVALGASGVKAIVAESYARIFFRNSVSTGELYPLESEARICDEFKTGEIVTVDLDGNKFINHRSGKEYVLQPIGDAGPVIDAGGIFNYARKTGMIAQTS